MDSTARYISQNFVDEMLDTILVSTDAPKEPSCSICGQDYGEPAEAQDSPALALFNALPMMTNFTQETVKPVSTPCGHIFCSPCICLWLAKHPNCPMCRAQFDVPHCPNSFRTDHAEDDSDSDSDDGSDDGPDNDSQADSDHEDVSGTDDYPDAEDERDFFENFMGVFEGMTIRDYLTWKLRYWFTHDPRAVNIVLPSIMVITARRFNSQAQIHGTSARTDMHDELFSFCNGPVAGSPIADMHAYANTAPRAPLAAHPDASRLYVTLKECLKRLHAMRPRPSMTDSAEEQLYAFVKEEMPDGNGGVAPRRWWAYVKCVVRFLVVMLAHRSRMVHYGGHGRPPNRAGFVGDIPAHHRVGSVGAFPVHR